MAIELIFIALVVSGILAFLVKGDASDRGMDGTLWFGIVLVSGLLGVVIYLLIRDPYSRNHRARAVEDDSWASTECPVCGQENEPDRDTCITCNTSL